MCVWWFRIISGVFKRLSVCGGVVWGGGSEWYLWALIKRLCVCGGTE